MHLILGIAAGFLALLQFGTGGALLGAALGVLAAEVLALRKRLTISQKPVWIPFPDLFVETS